MIGLPAETAYVDDVDNLSTSKEFLQKVLDVTHREYAKWNLSLNLSKTEHTDFYVAPPISKCPSCTKRCNTNACCCDLCGFWWHPTCAGVTPDQFSSFVADPTQTWHCPMCVAGAAPVRRGLEPWRTGKHLGVRLDVTQEVARRIQKAGWAYASLQKLWMRREIVSEIKRVRLFKAFVLPHFLYGLGAIPLSTIPEKRLDTAHRRLLRRLIRVWWPNKLSNDQLYERTSSIPISDKAREMRWAYLGHILRRVAESHPAALAFLCYFKCHETFSPSGHLQSDLIAVLRKDLKRTEHLHGLSLTDLSDAQTLIERAEDRKEWAGLMCEICARL